MQGRPLSMSDFAVDMGDMGEWGPSSITGVGVLDGTVQVCTVDKVGALPLVRCRWCVGLG